MRVTLLGTGTSTGVPVIGCGCPTCRSADPRDARLRTSALVETGPGDGDGDGAGGLSVVIDTGPDFRQQALRAGLRRVDAVLYTHAHFDHVAGLDDLRPFLFEERTAIPCYADAPTAAALRRVYPYVWGGSRYPGVPVLALHEIDPAPFPVASRYGTGAHASVRPVPVMHGPQPILGFRIGAFAYLTDVSAIPEPSFALLEGLDTLVLDALRPEPHPTHFTIGEAVAVARRIGARRTVFVHLTHNVLHADADAALPDGIALGYDGMVLDVRSAPAGARSQSQIGHAS